MSKRELIDAILKHNRTAAPEFLAKFTESDLKAYLERMALITCGGPVSPVHMTVDQREPLLVS